MLQHCFAIAETTSINVRRQIWSREYFKTISVSAADYTPVTGTNIDVIYSIILSRAITNPNYIKKNIFVQYEFLDKHEPLRYSYVCLVLDYDLQAGN